ncbi:MAG TPA: hypothetical protein VLW65_14510 [Bryobacteraceae bacterium]|nr:hypothetical protein [Bryobacteraceae bacterium]
MASGVIESLRRVHRELEQVCEMLLRPSPEALNDCEQRLARATVEMEASRPAWSEAARDRQAGEQARLVRHSLHHAQRLLENAARFHAGWRRRRAAMNGEYRADGSIPDLRCPARIFVEG